MPHDEKKLEVEGQNTTERVEHTPFPPAPAAPKKSDRSLLVYTAFAIGIALLVRFFIAAPYLVDGPSMEETFHNHDYLIVDRLTYRLGEPQRGDVIVFNSPASKGNTLIKRVIGLPGDTVTVSDAGVMIANTANPKGFVISESYIAPENLGGASGMSITLAPDHYFVMGDNRAVSYDSRSWGTLPGGDIIGRVMLRLYPFSDFGILPGEARY
ncbi:MAG TPA: signal peptidase I [Candidatus Paceibacterota bacterium]